jgi:hypothetical protein
MQASPGVGAATVGGVTKPDAPGRASKSAGPEQREGDAPGGASYVRARPVQRDGEPPYDASWSTAAPEEAPLLPGEGARKSRQAG